jgi:hypothetical protein
MKHRRDGVAERLDGALWGEATRNSGRNLVAKTPKPLAKANGSKTDSALASGN